MASGKAAKTPSSRRKSAKRERGMMSGPSKGLLDRIVVELRVFEHRPLAEIAALDGRSERQLERVVAAYEAHVAEHGEPPSELDMNPVAILRASLHRYGFQRELLYRAAANATTSAELVGAVKALTVIEEKQTGVLQAVGLLPRELRALGHLLEVQSAADELERLLDGLEDGSLTPAQVRGRMCEWAHVEAPVIEGTALTAA